MSAIRAENLQIRIGDHRAVCDVSFVLPEGAFLAILGPNGSGKSTLIRGVLGLLPASGGRIETLGRAPTDVPAGWIGYVPQLKGFDRSFPASAVDLVLTGLRCGWPWKVSEEDRERALACLSASGSAALASRAIGRLSGGELQRVFLARALIREPRLILLDEPAAGVDVAGEADLFETLEGIQRERGRTICLVTHDFDTALHHASHVLLLNKRQVAFGAPREALTRPFVQQAFGHAAHAHGIGAERSAG